MLDRLIRTNGSAKSGTLEHMLDRHFAASVGPSHLLEGHHYGSSIEQILQRHTTMRGITQRFRRMPVKIQPHIRLRGVHRIQRQMSNSGSTLTRGRIELSDHQLELCLGVTDAQHSNISQRTKGNRPHCAIQVPIPNLHALNAF